MIPFELDLEKPLIFELPAVFTAAECDRWIERIQSAGTELATINTKHGNEVDSQIRNNRRVIFDDPEWAHELFERVKDQVPQEIHEMSLAGVNERLRCYEYQAGQRFAPHSDGAFVRDDRERSWYTYMVYLNEEFEGGETVFFVEPEVIIKPRMGSALLFQHPIIHEGSEVRVGVKYVVRTDLMYATNSMAT
jgi:predicted 2-oxoglutarate/Fe(II)-dependent dioxygenase YbiX